MGITPIMEILLSYIEINCIMFRLNTYIIYVYIDVIHTLQTFTVLRLWLWDAIGLPSKLEDQIYLVATAILNHFTFPTANDCKCMFFRSRVSVVSQPLIYSSSSSSSAAAWTATVSSSRWPSLVIMRPPDSSFSTRPIS